jgi:hypothetical protein
MSDTPENISRLRAEVHALRSVVLQILASAANGQVPSLGNPVIQQFLGVRDGEEPRAALARLVDEHAPVIGVVNCTRCGALVEDVLGVKDELCIFCGQEQKTLL